MPKKQIIKTCENIGNQLSQDFLTTQRESSPSRVKELLTNTIGAKKASKVIITDDLVTFKEFAKKEIGLTDEVSEMFYNSSKSAVIPGPKSNRSLLCLKTKNMRPDEMLNLTSHELEHVLNQRLGFRAFIEKIYMKVTSKKYLENYTKKYGNIVNEKNMDLQANLIIKSKLGLSASHGFTSYEAGIEGLLKQTGLKSKEELHKILENLIRKKIILPDCDKRNLKILQALKTILKDESRAYKVGGTVERNHANASTLKYLTENGTTTEFKPTTNLTKAEMLAQLYDEAIVILKKEIRHQKTNKVKRFLGLKPKDYHKAVAPQKPAPIETKETLISADEIPKEIKDALG